MRGSSSNAKLTSCHAAFFTQDIGFAKSCCLSSSTRNQSLLYFGEREGKLDWLVSAVWFTCSNFIFSVVPGRFLLFILEKLSFFIGVLTLKHSKTLKSPSEVIFIITKWSRPEAVKTCPSPVIDTKLNHILCL